MIKKLIYVFILLTIVSCGASRNKRITQTKNRTNTTKNNSSNKVVVIVTDDKENEQKEAKEELEATSKVSATYSNVNSYIDSFKDVAKLNMKQYGIPASIILAQGILESGAGNGRLCKEANNHFGIKCHKEWNGPSITHDDDAAQECFRKYDDPSESYRDHSLFLTSRSRYNKLFELDKGDFKSWAKGLKAAGYATDPKYPSKLIGIIERYQLDKYDNEVLNRIENIKSDNEVKNNDISNNVSLYIIQKGDTLYSLSRKFNLSVEELKKINGLKDNSLSIGQKIRLK
ncbi:LysM peptidoglycan-binding domain-containing protein [Flavobacterium jejuense]|uniref:Peptidoglycan hydrolase n=1 Tax=Flavobacterium jejuense TaxID=1544455 RepID=A0ABX0IRH2_9FLAO|nr:glucosaminidase domain-containing protein [Flavobacterium jejuense]NHN25384.1 LysM peptidoglycan-binding domain-containing protein [Flavobacterium jejuense]